MKKHLVVISLICLLIQTGCLETSNQKAKDIFADRSTLPLQLEQKANPAPRGTVQSYSQNSPHENVIRVAVVDSGVDYNNPHLFYQTDIQVKNGRFAGAGADLLGDDSWANPNLIKADLYSFTATELKDRQMVGTAEDPIREIFRINSELISVLKKEVNSHPLLKTSLFARKIHPKSMSFLVARQILKNEFDTEAYNERKEKKTLITTTTGLSEEGGSLVNQDWTMGDRPSMADFAMYLDLIEHGDLMYALIQKTYEELNNKYQIERRLRQMSTFNNQNPDDTRAFDQVLKAFHEDIVLLTSQFRSSSPLNGFFQSYCSFVEPYYKLNPAMQTAQGHIKPEFVAQIRNKFFADVSTYMKDLRKIVENDESDIESLTNVEQDFPVLKQRFDAIVKQYGDQVWDCSHRSVRIRDRHHEKIVRGNSHPLLDKATGDASHGSHVSGIIIRQSPRVKVTPVRVITQNGQSSGREDRLLQEQFVSDFAAWMNIPAIREVFISRLSSFTSGNSQENIKAVAQEFLSNEFKDVKLHLMFFKEIIQAVRYVGSQKIKIANLSLGLNYEIPVAGHGPQTRRVKLKKEMDFLMMEFFKFKVASEVSQNASKTLFVIASGNDGKWLDGKSRSGLPCDLSSSELKKTAAGKNMINNQLKNVLCVGSINPNDEISSFSNIPLTDVPFIFGYGESILSTIQTNSCEGNNQDLEVEISKNLGQYRLPMVLSRDKEMNEIFLKLGWIVPNSTYDDSAASLRVMDLDEVFNNMSDVIKNEACAERPNHFARMSGTSMATPAVAGYIARRLVALSRSEKITENQIYDSPEYSPENIIRALRERSPKFGGESVINSVAKIVRMKTWEQVLRDRTQNSQEASAVISNVQAAPVFDMTENARFPNSVPKDKSLPETQDRFWPEFKSRPAKF